MNLSEIISNQLKINDTVIIPDLGAFITEKIPARLDEKSDTIHPPSKELRFNENVKNNEGLLVQAVAKEFNISEHEANNKVKDKVSEIIYSLDKDNEYDFGELGILMRDEFGKLNFQSKENLMLNSTDYGLTSKKIDFESKSEKKDSPKPIATPIPNIENNDKKDSKTSSNSVILEDNHIDKKEQNSNTQKPPIMTKERTVIEKENPIIIKEEEKKNNYNWLWLLLLLLLIGFLVWWFLLRDKADEIPPQENKVETVFPITEKEPIKEEVVETNNAPKEEIVEESEYENVIDEDLPPYTKPAIDKFYIVNGSFKAKSNAMEHYNNMKARGFDPKYIGTYNDFYMISIAEYDTERKSFIGKNILFEKYPAMDFWVYSHQLLSEY